MKAAARARLLPFIILALGVFAALKIGNVWIGFSGATAQEEGVTPSTSIISAGQSAAAASSPRGVEAPAIAPGEVERRILEKLAERRAALDAREQKLETREIVIAAAEAKLKKQIDVFERERDQLLALRDQQEAVEAQDIEALVSAYERMKAKDAAVIFNELNEEILLSVASGMRTQALAGVLAEMRPEKARELTVLLAEQGQLDLALTTPVTPVAQ